jgi:hypothetical protein
MGYNFLKIILVLTISLACLGDLISDDVNDDFLCLPPDFFAGLCFIALMLVCFKFYFKNKVFTRVNEFTAYLAMREKSPPAIIFNV